MRTGSPDEIVEHYSHLFRTPLGVALGVINDLVGGYRVEAEDLKDAQAALERMVVLLDEMRGLRKSSPSG